MWDEQLVMATQVSARVLLHICFVPRCTQTKLQTGLRQTASSSTELEESPSSLRKKDFHFCLLTDQQGLSLFPLPIFQAYFIKKPRLKKKVKKKDSSPGPNPSDTGFTPRGEAVSLLPFIWFTRLFLPHKFISLDQRGKALFQRARRPGLA